MNISRLLEMDTGQLISIVGGGGKTSLMKKLSLEFCKCGKNVLVTTTTAIYVPNGEWVHRVVVTREGENELFSETGGITALGSYIDENKKLRGVPAQTICSIKGKGIFDLIIVESDGSRGRPVKAPAAHEPVIAPCSDIVVGVIGMDCIGKVIDESVVHRVDEFCRVAGKKEGDIIECGDIARLIMSPFGIFKGAEGSKRYVLLNKVEYEWQADCARNIIERVKNIQVGKEAEGHIENHISGILAGSLKKGRVDTIWKKAWKLQE
ncbi:probable selenium-dependent hydroxylase accessory protein YqeC [Peptoclostridium litorale DSM 5388]|uniref:Selenium-dependent hydroxylase accessory protein YqeC n=1 Tax=Peptoclostridium litorale DSM 5388 TaxID=1121324 RepID=A0A069RHV9_PEPLI|nr:selenium cofactor biosynthesis protein YqeC [Peptoclostridium litorale]KDR95735.1 hypothetical protein CLIT_10c04620 [Peptoclostridium litorale DSM 5388]SIO22359.1 probable selenium-dependent hydroxylase accessory protein YqeC [Peptoclostridium litorale DSM 5388]